MKFVKQNEWCASSALLTIALCTMPVVVSAQTNKAAELVPTLSLLLFDDTEVKYKPLNDSGITWGGNYPDGYELDCTSNIIGPQDCHQGRDATHNDDSDGHAGFSYAKLSSTGIELDASAASWSCVRDNVTNLIWEVKTDDDGIHDKDNTYRWGGITHLGTGLGTYYDDWDTLVDGSNNNSLCGFNDWRVPTIDELQSMVNYHRVSPAIDADYFPNTGSQYFWSASPRATYSGTYYLAVGVRFQSGKSEGEGREAYRSVRLVRNVQ